MMVCGGVRGVWGLLSLLSDGNVYLEGIMSVGGLFCLSVCSCKANWGTGCTLVEGGGQDVHTLWFKNMLILVL